jgi:glycosyltransferase involved in cell wall biosynthesis
MLAGRKIAVVMPARNSEKTLRQTYDELPHDIIDDVILTDNASSDNTVALAQSLGIHVIRHDRNRGYGGSQKSCYTAALARGADIVIMVHPDYQYSPRLVTAMAGMVASGHYEAVFGSRMLSRGAIDGGMPIYKYVANRLLTGFQNFVMGQRLSEYHTGYRAWDRSVLEKLPLLACSDDFVFDNQMVAQAAWHGVKMGEISCPTRYFDEASSIDFHNSCIYGLGVLRTALDYRLSRWGLKPPTLFEPGQEARLPAEPIYAAALQQ